MIEIVETDKYESDMYLAWQICQYQTEDGIINPIYDLLRLVDKDKLEKYLEENKDIIQYLPKYQNPDI